MWDWVKIALGLVKLLQWVTGQIDTRQIQSATRKEQLLKTLEEYNGLLQAAVKARDAVIPNDPDQLRNDRFNEDNVSNGKEPE